VIDDKRGVTPKIKFLFIFFATCILYLNGVAVSSLGSYLGYEVTLPLILILPFTFFAIAGFTNAFNLLDGLDGLAGAVGLVMLGAFLAIGILHNDTLIITLSSLFVVAVFTFLLFNWHPAKIFMGDSGSLTLGFVISILSIQSLQYLTPAAVLFIIALPVLDTFIVMTRRIQRGISPFKADRNHMHHFLYKAKLDVKFTVILIVYVQIAFSIIGYQLNQTDNFLNLILFGILFYVFLNLLDQRIKHRHKD
jgi:UDP-GlcNAc:undecaprenyl-phosphate GlcNAc-1-phosphate transferase